MSRSSSSESPFGKSAGGSHKRRGGGGGLKSGPGRAGPSHMLQTRSIFCSRRLKWTMEGLYLKRKLSESLMTLA